MNDASAQSVHSASQSATGIYPAIGSRGGAGGEMTIAKRHAVILMLSKRNDKYNELREKNRVFSKWSKAVRDAQAFST